MRRKGVRFYLSERNLLALLTKLQHPDSARTILAPEGWSVTAEPDDVHYAGRDVPPGVMHPMTERDIESTRGTV